MAAAIIVAALGVCAPRRGCNAPSAYCTMTLSSSSTLAYAASTGFPTASLAAVEKGTAITQNFLGHASETRVYMYEPNGPDEAYTSVTESLCAFLGRDDPGCGQSEVSTAQDGGGQYYLSGRTACICDGYT